MGTLRSDCFASAVQRFGLMNLGASTTCSRIGQVPPKDCKEMLLKNSHFSISGRKSFVRCSVPTWEAGLGLHRFEAYLLVSNWELRNILPRESLYKIYTYSLLTTRKCMGVPYFHAPIRSGFPCSRLGPPLTSCKHEKSLIVCLC